MFETKWTWIVPYGEIERKDRKMKSKIIKMVEGAKAASVDQVEGVASMQHRMTRSDVCLPTATEHADRC